MTCELSAISVVTPLAPPILTLFPIFKWPEIPAWPPIIVLFPIIVLPEIPTCPAIIQFSPILTLWAICIWLSKKVFLPKMVSEIDPLSIVLFDPISTPSSKITLPMWGVLIFLLLLGIKPKPFTPTYDPSWMTTLSEINEFLITTKEPIIQLRPIFTLLSIMLLLEI